VEPWAWQQVGVAGRPPRRPVAQAVGEALA
jgi:hypothetical protein